MGKGNAQRHRLPAVGPAPRDSARYLERGAALVALRLNLGDPERAADAAVNTPARFLLVSEQAVPPFRLIFHAALEDALSDIADWEHGDETRAALLADLGSGEDAKVVEIRPKLHVAAVRDAEAIGKPVHTERWEEHAFAIAQRPEVARPLRWGCPAWAVGNQRFVLVTADPSGQTAYAEPLDRMDISDAREVAARAPGQRYLGLYDLDGPDGARRIPLRFTVVSQHEGRTVEGRDRGGA